MSSYISKKERKTKVIFMKSNLSESNSFWSRPDGISLFDLFSIAFVAVYLFIVFMAVMGRNEVAIDIQDNMNILMTAIIGSYAGDQITNRIITGSDSQRAEKRREKYSEKDFEDLL